MASGIDGIDGIDGMRHARTTFECGPSELPPAEPEPAVRYLAKGGLDEW